MPKRPVHETWPELDDDGLLEFRMSDLPLAIEGTLAQRTEQLREELRARGLNFKLHFYLSDEWFTPDGATAIAIPFYLAHSRLEKLEDTQMLEVEGGEYEWCMRILRHEAGHAIDNAFRLHRRGRYRELFGSFSSPYPDWYKPEPNSRDYVLHLPAWYAQAHPAEDFAETFAVWVRSSSWWKKRYAGWPALRKLNYVDHVMRELEGKPPVNKSRDRVEDLHELRLTLREHYVKKREHYAFHWPPDYDRAILRIFSAARGNNSNAGAASFMLRHRRTLCSEVSEATGAHQYAINQMLSHMINRCRELKLHVDLTDNIAMQKVLVALTVQTMNGIHSGYHRIAL